MVSNIEITNKGLEKAQQRYEQAKQKLAEEMAKAKEEKRRAETHHKCVMGGLVAKYLPECYLFEESELNNIIQAAIQSADCRNARPPHYSRLEVIIVAVKTVSSKASIVSRKKGQNAVEKSAYISRTTIETIIAQNGKKKRGSHCKSGISGAKFEGCFQNVKFDYKTGKSIYNRPG